MKYLKNYKLFESDEIDYYNGLIKEDIEDMFLEISDMGFDVFVYFSKRLVVKDKDWKIGNTRTTYGEIPYIEIRILHKRTDNPIEITSMKVLERNQCMKNLKDSEEFKSLIDEVNNRISHNDWYVSESIVIQDTLETFLHRKQDSKYVN